jgi:hypothetical protein
MKSNMINHVDSGTDSGNDLPGMVHFYPDSLHHRLPPIVKSIR